MQFFRNISIATRFLSSSNPFNITQQVSRGLSGLTFAGFGFTCSSINSRQILQPTSTLLELVRTNVRNHFPKAKEHHRIRKHGWKKRLSTAGGRAIIMRRILKGRHQLTH